MNIDTETLRMWLDEGRPVTVVDVRPRDQRAEWSIPGSVHADVYDALKRDDSHAMDGLDLPKDVPVVTVCAMGRISLKAADLLRKTGLEVLSLEGGMQAWSQSWNVAEIEVGLPGVSAFQIRRVGKGCLSYLIAADGLAAVLDPALDPEVYLRFAERKGVRITAVLDTHFHADHFSRAHELAVSAGAVRYVPDNAATRSGTPLREGDSLPIGRYRLKALRTPGHTPESSCYQLEDCALFTGDTLFLESVGRPDLADLADPVASSHAVDSAESADPEYPVEPLKGGRVRLASETLFDSLRRIAALPPSILILPAHHSAPPAFDGKPLLATLAETKVKNRFLRYTLEEFLAEMHSGSRPTPPNHLQIIDANKTDAPLVGDWMALEAAPNRCARA